MKSLFGTIYMLFLALQMYAQPLTGERADKWVAGATQVTLHPEGGMVRLATFDEGVAINPEDASPWLLSTLRIEGGISFELLKVQGDKLGMLHAKYRQLYSDIPIENSALTLHIKGGNVKSLSGVYHTDLSGTSTSASLSANDAIERAKTHTRSGEFMWADDEFPAPELVILPKGENYILAYKTDIYSLNPFERKYHFVDAQTGEIVDTYDRIHETGAIGTAHTRYSGERTIRTDSMPSGHFRLRDYTRSADIITRDLNGGTNYLAATDVTDADNIWEAANHNADAVLDAHWGTEMTFDYFWETHGLNSLDGDGAPLLTYVDYGVGFVNAFWNGEVMTYGAGSGIYAPLTCLDIVGHEVTHGITQFSAGLIYAFESGALNESFSDIFGVTVDFYAREGLANFEVGEDVFPEPIRSMANPNLYNSPDTYLGTHWVTGSFDNGGVHFNSGVQNYWFYLLCEGGAGVNDNGDAYNIAPIGMEAAADIAFRNLTVYLTPGSQYSDARFYAIQSAIDLYGPCSEEVIAVTNAWHAVGVGGMFDDAVIAQFSVSNTYACDVPALVQFNNQSINSTSYLWDFGDGNSSTEADPQHSYVEVGIYTVSLTVEGSADCSENDAVVLNNLIEVTDIGGPASATCQPVSILAAANRGISFFGLEGISNSSGSSLLGYEDFSCTSSAALIEGNAYTMQVNTLSPEYVKVWIDLNGDNAFTANELVYASATNVTTHNVEVIIPQGAVYEAPLRLRVQSSLSITTDACQAVNGQVEDYAVSITENLSPPEANFYANVTIAQPTEPVLFSDVSINLPSSWNWTFEGGSPVSSTEQNPTVTYATEGVYDVMLVVTNDYGGDTLLIENYINVVSSINMCSQTLTTSPSGLFYDSGGPDGNYSNNENCTLLISPACAQSITLTFSEFWLESCCDLFRAYDGNSINAPLLFSGNGTNMPPPLTATSGEMFIRFTSDFSVTRPGWAAEWTSETPDEEPVAAFAISNENPPLNTAVVFTDQSLVFPASWSWDFGDGSTSTEQSPVHVYTEPGVYTVSLEVSNCYGSDATSQVITVQDAPSMSILPADTLHVIIPCGSMAVGSFTITNNGLGDLEVASDFQGISTPEVLAWIPMADIDEEYANTLTAINTHFTDYSLTESYAMTAQALEMALTDIDILLVPEQEGINQQFFTPFAQVLMNYANSGGRILFCASQGLQNSGVLSGVFEGQNFASVPLVNEQPEHPMMSNINVQFQSDNMTTFYNWLSDPEMLSLAVSASSPSQTAVGIKPFGDGLVAYVGYDFFTISTNNAQIIGNTMEFFTTSIGQPWIESVSMEGTVTVPAGESLLVDVSFDASGMLAGQYYQDVTIFSNDAENSTVPYVFHLEVSGEALLEVESQNLDFGSIFLGAVSGESIVVVNAGCDALSIAANVVGPNFSVVQQEFVIEGLDQDTLVINFHPTALGTLNDILELSSNGGSASVILTGIGMEAPVMVLSPSFIDVDVPACADSVLVNFAIANTGGGILEYTLGGQASLLSLEEVAALLSVQFSSITALVPNIHNFAGGESGNHISNGGGGMYDNGNYLNTNIQNGINYTGSNILESDAFGPESRYFTSKHPGLFVLAADLSQIETFFITGYTGAFTWGLINGLVLNYSSNSGVEYTGFVTRVFGAGTPTINHLIITESKPGIAHTFPNNAIVQNHNVSGLIDNDRLHYLLFATAQSAYVDDAQMQEIFETYVNMMDGQGSWSTAQSGSVLPGEDVEIELYIPTSTLNYGEYETYIYVSSNDPILPLDSILVTLNIGPDVCPLFDYQQVSTCGGIFAFTDQSTNNPTSWSWDFGDGNTSNQQNPVHQFNSSGTFTVVLEVCNEFDCNTFVLEVLVEGAGGPIPASCTPTTSGSSPQHRINSFSLANLQNSSGGSANGYQDFSCLEPAEVTVGQNYLYQASLSQGQSFNFRIWIDLNNNGIFEENELQASSSNIIVSAVGMLTIPVAGVYGTPLRMRVLADPGSGNPCNTLINGEVEDYAVIINPITEPPAADFSWFVLNNCQGVAQFNDNSSNLPNYWLWDFGDGNISNLQNPMHIYGAGGVYNVKLIAYNSLGSDTLFKNVTIPYLGFSSVQTTGQMLVNTPVNFSAPGDGVAIYNWNFGNGATVLSVTPNVPYVYNAPGTYLVTVSTTSSVCNNSVSLHVTISTFVSDGIDNAGGAIVVYPNPSNGRFNIRFPEHLAIQSIRVFDPLGKILSFQIFHEEPDQIGVLLANPVAGLYIVEAITIGGDVLRSRLIME